MLTETEFHRRADATLTTLAQGLEPAYEAGDLEELELSGGILTIETAGKTLVVSKHAASQEIWLASPTSGGLHFPYKDGIWQLADGRTLTGVLSIELGLGL